MFSVYNNKKGKISYSQSGEDLIVRRILNRIGIKNPTYLDIGAHHPIKNNNTYLLYTNGAKGVLIEPDKVLFEKLQGKRKRDTVLHCGVGVSGKSTADFYVMSNSALSTFSKEEAEQIQSYGKDTILRTVKVPLMHINEVIKKYFEGYPNFISLDVEGLDYEILKKLDFKKFGPEVLCVETITYTQNNTEEKREEIFHLMKENGYITFADTYINTIFVKENTWRNR